METTEEIVEHKVIPFPLTTREFKGNGAALTFFSDIEKQHTVNDVFVMGRDTDMTKGIMMLIRGLKSNTHVHDEHVHGMISRNNLDEFLATVHDFRSAYKGKEVMVVVTDIRFTKNDIVKVKELASDIKFTFFYLAVSTSR